MTDEAAERHARLIAHIAEQAECVAQIRASQPYDGRRLTMRETRAGWTYVGLCGTCAAIASDGKHLVLVVEHDPEGYWPVGQDVLVELDEESVPIFDEYS